MSLFVRMLCVCALCIFELSPASYDSYPPAAFDDQRRNIKTPRRVPDFSPLTKERKMKVLGSQAVPVLQRNCCACVCMTLFLLPFLRLQTGERGNICIRRTKKRRRKDVHVLFGADEKG